MPDQASSRTSLMRGLAVAVLIATVGLPASAEAAGPLHRSKDLRALRASVAAPATPRPVIFAQEPTTVELPATIDSTGTTDVSDQLNAFFRQLPDNRRVVLRAGGTYRIEKAVVIQGKRDLLLDGNGAKSITTTRGDRVRQHWRFLGGERLVVRNLTVVGANPNAGTSEAAGVRELEAQHGFNFAGSHGVELDGVTVTDVYGDFVYLGWDSGNGRWTEDVHIHDSTFLRNGRQGMAFTGARRVRVEGNRIGETRRATFDLEPNGGGTGVEDVVIENNDVGAGRLNFIAAVGVGPVNRIAVRNNRLTGRAMNSTIGSTTERRRDWQVTGNVSDSSYGNPGGGIMAFRLIDRLVVSGNVQRAQAGRNMYLVDTNRVCGVRVSRNTVSNGAGQHRVSTPC